MVPILVYFSGWMGMFTGGTIWMLTHGPIALCLSFFLMLWVAEVDPARQRFAQLYLVDLAGSERVMKTGVQGMQLEEALFDSFSTRDKVSR